MIRKVALSNVLRSTLQKRNLRTSTFLQKKSTPEVIPVVGTRIPTNIGGGIGRLPTGPGTKDPIPQDRPERSPDDGGSNKTPVDSKSPVHQDYNPTNKVTNNSKTTVYLKIKTPDGKEGIKKLFPGESFEGDIDGIYNPEQGFNQVYKIANHTSATVNSDNSNSTDNIFGKSLELIGEFTKLDILPGSKGEDFLKRNPDWGEFVDNAQRQYYIELNKWKGSGKPGVYIP
jgi:hypothetical protein